MPSRQNDILVARAAILSLGLALACSGCKKTAKETSAPEAQTPEASAAVTRKAMRAEGFAVWYDVPADSLTKRRAGKDEFTAAHNRLPLGTVVRVTHLANGKSVIVRITDRGITDRHSVIDLCKEAAAELGILSEGSARVRLEVLPDAKSASPAPSSQTTAAQP